MEKVFSEIIDRAQITPEEIADGDYYEGDLLYCGKCHTKKETVITLRFRDRSEVHKVRCVCKCEAEVLDRLNAQQREEAIRAQQKELRNRGFEDSQIANFRFENDDGKNPDVMRVARNYADKFHEFMNDGKGLLLYGTVGNGKTYAAACIVNALIDNLVSCHMTNIPRIASNLKAVDNENEVLDELCFCDLLVIDDFGVERNTEYMNEIVNNVIDSRYRSRKPLIVTTNLTPMEIKNVSSVNLMRTMSRLLEMCIPVEVKGEDRRRQKLRDSYKTYKEMLEV